MDIGPVEILVVGFPGNQFNGDVAPALAELVQSGMIRVIDLVFVTKDAAGDVVGVELVRHRRSRRARRSSPTSRSRAGCSPTRTSKTWAPTWRPTRRRRSCLFEHLWATKFRDAVLGLRRRAARLDPDPEGSRWTRSSARAELGTGRNAPTPQNERDIEMLRRRGRPILRTAAVVGTASAVSGSVQHHQQQKYAAQDAEAQQAGSSPQQAATLRRPRRRRPT